MKQNSQELLLLRRVGRLCAVSLADLGITSSDLMLPTIANYLQKIDVKIVSIKILEHLVQTAKKCVGSYPYRRGASWRAAPQVMDCSGLTKWIYGQAGIWLPRHSIDQFALGIPVTIKNIRSGDLLFTQGAIPWYWENPAQGIGHVGIASGPNTVIHAACTKRGIVEDPIENFTKNLRTWRGARRILNDPAKIIVCEVLYDIETSRQLRWHLLGLKKPSAADQ